MNFVADKESQIIFPVSEFLRVCRSRNDSIGHEDLIARLSVLCLHPRYTAEQAGYLSRVFRLEDVLAVRSAYPVVSVLITNMMYNKPTIHFWVLTIMLKQRF